MAKSASVVATKESVVHGHQWHRRIRSSIACENLSLHALPHTPRTNCGMSHVGPRVRLRLSLKGGLAHLSTSPLSTWLGCFDSFSTSGKRLDEGSSPCPCRAVTSPSGPQCQSPSTSDFARRRSIVSLRANSNVVRRPDWRFKWQASSPSHRNYCRTARLMFSATVSPGCSSWTLTLLSH